MKWLGRTVRALWLLSFTAACSAAVATAPVIATVPAMPSPAAEPTLLAGTGKPSTGFPHCDGMQILAGPVQFNWPDLVQHQQDFSRSQWTYYSCDQPPAQVAALYRQQLPKPPYGMDEVNWLDKREGALGIYFSQTGAWNYIWFVPQPGEAQKSYVVISETFAYVECF